MKTVFRLVALTIVAGLIFSCSSKQAKTIDNLKAAYNGESTASVKYAAFADKAVAEGYDTLALLFRAASKAEDIHASNHLKVLETLGAKPKAPQIGEFEVLSSAENLADAIKGETYEAETMYPQFITQAEADESSDALETFTWALETEKKHQQFYTNALASVTNVGEKDLPSGWSVCPTCGNTYDTKIVSDPCEFCGTEKEKFITI